MSIEYKSVSFEVKDIDRKQGIFEGYASVFENEDSHGDTIMPGAFTKTLLERLPKSKIKVLWQHDPYTPIGKPIEMREDSTGLFTRSKISETSQGVDALKLIEDGVITEMSIGFNIVKQEVMDERTYKRRIHEVKLYEYSPVTWGANELAFITGVKSDNYTELITRARSLMTEVKAGRMLSEKNRTLLEGCKSQLAEAIESLQALLAVEPDKSTPEPEAAKSEAHEPEELHSLLIQLREMRHKWHIAA